MRPANEQIASGKAHEYTREKGYVEVEHEHREYPKVVGDKTVNSAEEEAALTAPAEESKPKARVVKGAKADAKADEVKGE